MKYLKTFESYREEPKFFRFSHIDLLGDKDQSEFTPIERRMVGPDEYNDILVSLGFPNKNFRHNADEVLAGHYDVRACVVQTRHPPSVARELRRAVNNDAAAVTI